MSAGLQHIKALQMMRIEKEMKGLKSKQRDYIVSYQKAGEKEIWNFKIKPKTAPFLGMVLTLAIDCTGDYPFRPPLVRFVYHPNVDKTGEVCIPIVAYDNWKPTTTMDSIIDSVLLLLAEPDLSRPIRFDLADEFLHNNNAFLQNAVKQTLPCK